MYPQINKDMKKLILLMMLAVTSCKVCYDCTTTVTTTVSQATPGYPQTGSSVTEVCGERERRAIDGKSTTTTASANGITVITVSKSKCKEQ